MGCDTSSLKKINVPEPGGNPVSSGNSGSKKKAITGPKISASRAAQALDDKLVAAVVGAKSRSMVQKKKFKSFNFLMMQFPKLRKGFKKVHELFRQVNAGGGKFMDWETFKLHCGDLGLDPTSQELRDAFLVADMDDRRMIDANELVIIFTIVFLLDGSTDKHVIRHPEIKESLDIVEQAFVFFDSSRDGNLERKEVVMAMKSGTRVFGRKQAKSLADRLFDELDLDGSGSVTFKEFLVAIMRMALECDDEEEDEEDYLIHEADDGASLVSNRQQPALNNPIILSNSKRSSEG